MATFTDRLRDNALTNAEQYRRMRKSISGSGERESLVKNDEWKDWELAPVNAGRHSDGQKGKVEFTKASDLVRALSVL